MKKKIKVGIIGGGQLGMMLAEASSKLNIVPLVYSNTKDSPAAKVAKTYYGDFNDDKKIAQVAADYIAKSLDSISEEYERGWQGSFDFAEGYIFSRKALASSIFVFA